ncbi:site-specific integrase [bacterium]|nr:site-specific integrase [bacterium]
MERIKEEIIDPYKHKQTYDNWKKTKPLKGLNEINRDVILNFLNDMALGLNIAKVSKKGARGPTRLNTLRARLCFIISKLQERKVKDIRKVTDKDLHSLFEDMRNGTLKTRTGTAYKSAGDYVKVFKTFWHWYEKIMKKKGKIVEDVTEDLDTRGEKPKFVYFTEEDFEKIVDKAKYDLKIILALAFDSGVRVTELVNIKVSDFLNNFKELNIRDETSKTFGRKIKIMLCADQVKEYVKKLDLKPNDFFCKIHPSMINAELNKIGKEVLMPEQIKFKNLSLYDFRHSSACFWLPRYKSESALKYRFGWKKSDMIHYYTEFLGMKDTINQEDMYVDMTKTELEKDMSKLKKENKIQRETTIKLESEQIKLYEQIKKLVNMTKISREATGKNKDVKVELKEAAKRMILKGELDYPPH